MQLMNQNALEATYLSSGSSCGLSSSSSDPWSSRVRDARAEL